MDALRAFRQTDRFLAAQQLARVSLFEDLATLYEEASQPDRDVYASRYEELVGIHPRDRHSYGAALREIEDDETLATTCLRHFIRWRQDAG